MSHWTMWKKEQNMIGSGLRKIGSLRFNVLTDIIGIHKTNSNRYFKHFLVVTFIGVLTRRNFFNLDILSTVTLNTLDEIRIKMNNKLTRHLTSSIYFWYLVFYTWFLLFSVKSPSFPLFKILSME